MVTRPLRKPRKRDAEAESRDRVSNLLDLYDGVIQSNRRVERKYRAEEAALLKKLHKVQAKLRDSRIIRKPEAEKQEVFRYYSVGKPYFKDKNLNHPPDNEDTIIMKQYQMYDFSNIMAVSGWTVGDKARLLSVLLELSKDIVRNDLFIEIARLQKIKPRTSTISAKLDQLKHKLLAVKYKKSLEDLDLKVDQEFEWDEIAQKLNKRHSPREYKAIWDLFFHPRVNKSSWGPKEHQDLQRIAAEHNMQDWESIAKTLNRGRTAYQCFVYFRTNVSHSASGRRWSEDEMNYLQRVIDLYKEETYIPWGKVAASMQNRTKIQCYNKHIRMVEGRKGRFLPEEDSVILNFVNVYGTDFRKMSSFLTGRSAIQLRVRYNLLLKIRVSTTWSVEDDRKLLQIMANQDSRTNFSTATKHFPGKDRQNIRSRYNTLIRWMKSHPHSDVCTAPRRAARRLYHGAPGGCLARALAALRDRMRAELEAEPPARRCARRLTRDASENVIHDAILTTISTLDAKAMYSLSMMQKTQMAKVEDSYQMMKVRDISSTPEEKMNVFNVKQLLFLLNARLPDKNKFYSSEIGRGFEEVENMKVKDLTQLKMRSYSKREVSVDEELIKPNLFGSTVNRRRFLIPPNFATITGSRVILNLLSNMFMKEKNDTNIKLLARRNALLEYHLTQLRERFIDLFSWSYVLSNEPPEYYKLYAADLIKKRANAKKIVAKLLPQAPAVTIPPPPPRRLRLKPRIKNPEAGTEAGIDNEAEIDTEAMEVDDNLIEIEHTFARISDPFTDDEEEPIKF